MLFTRPLIKTAQSVRTVVINGPPSVPLTTMDKCIHGFIIYFAMLSFPMYITYKLKDLRENK